MLLMVVPTIATSTAHCLVGLQPRLKFRNVAVSSQSAMHGRLTAFAADLQLRLLCEGPQ
jgi:hypothetical protein